MDMLCHAVRMARDQQVQRLATLRQRPHNAFPGEEAVVDEAIGFWGRYEAQKRQRGLDN